MARKRGGGSGDDDVRKHSRDSQDWRHASGGWGDAPRYGYGYNGYAAQPPHRQEYPQHACYQPQAAPQWYGQSGYEGGFSAPPPAYGPSQDYWRRNGSASQYGQQQQEQQQQQYHSDRYAYAYGPRAAYDSHAAAQTPANLSREQQWYYGQPQSSEAARPRTYGADDGRVMTAGRHEGSWHSYASKGIGSTTHNNSAPSRPRAYAPRTLDSFTSQRSYYSHAGGSRSRKQSPDRKTARHNMRTAPPVRPRPYYVQQTRRSPLVHAFSDDGSGQLPLPPRPLPLLVLDLNGTLVYRGKRTATVSTTERSRKPKLRPYLTCFLQYCLAVEGSQRKAFDEQQAEWALWDKKRSQETQDKELDAERTHGSHFWPDQMQEPQPQPKATYRLLLWSSAQPQNVDLMARAILSPLQAEQLLRVYARDTLVVRQLIHDKVPSIKDLEILWSALNNAELDMPNRRRGEARLFADARRDDGRSFSPSHKKGDKRSSAKDDLRALWEDGVCLPRLDKDSGRFVDGKGYGPCNTLLLDDSLDKAAMQPFNHLLIPDFDEKRSAAVDKYMDGSKPGSVAADESDDDASESELSGVSSLGKLHLGGKDGSPEPPNEPEDVLLQTIGVLEHARHYGNVSSWIYHGGLGDFGGVAEERLKIDGGNVSVGGADDDDASLAWQRHFSEAVPQSSLVVAKDDKSDDSDMAATPVRLQARLQDRTPAFWAAEGRAALRRKGIAVRMFA